MARWGGEWEGTPHSVLFPTSDILKRQEVKFALRAPDISYRVLDSDDLFPLLV